MLPAENVEVLPGVRRSMQGNKSRDTKPELRVRSILHSRGLRFRVCHKPLQGVRNSADVVFTRAKVAVFIDGCYWHGCPEHFVAPKTNVDYWAPKISRNVARDRGFDARLLEAGWAVVRAWEHEDPVLVADRVERLVREAAEVPDA